MFTAPAVATPVTAAWAVDAGGNWSVPANWSGGAVPNSVDSVAQFPDLISAPRVVTADAAPTVRQLQFNSTRSYTLAGPGAITLSASVSNAEVDVLNGSHTISTPLILDSDTTFLMFGESTLDISGPLTAAGRTITTITFDGVFQFRNLRAAGLNVTEGGTRIAPDGTTAGTSELGALTIADNGELDLTNNDLQITGGNSYAQIAALIFSGLHGGGSPSGAAALLSSTARSDVSGRTTLGTMTGAQYKATGRTTFDGFAVGDGDVLVKYTLSGDANLDGAVDLTDFTFLAANFNKPSGAQWLEGDYNYDGKLDLTDFTFLASNFNQRLSPAGGGGGASLGTSVPEPVSVTLIGFSWIALTRRAARRRACSRRAAGRC